jgi:hypothetical protein
MLYKMISQYRPKFVAIAILAVFIIILLFITGYPNFIERFYSEGLYLFFCRVLHPVFNLHHHLWPLGFGAAYPVNV